MDSRVSSAVAEPFLRTWMWSVLLMTYPLLAVRVGCLSSLSTGRSVSSVRSPVVRLMLTSG